MNDLSPLVTSPMLLISLAAGLVIGAAIGLLMKLRRARLPSPGVPAVLTWPRGLGRARILKSSPSMARQKTFRVSAPLMRDSYGPPEVGQRVAVKIDGGQAFRAEFMGAFDDSWLLRKSV